VLAAPTEGNKSAQQAVRLYEQKEYKKAADEFEKLFNSGLPPSANYFYYAALSNQNCQQIARAEQLFKYIIQNYPGTVHAQYSARALVSIAPVNALHLPAKGASDQNISRLGTTLGAQPKSGNLDGSNSKISHRAKYTQMFFESTDPRCHKILFIGNSLTYVNQLPIMLAALALNSQTCSELRIGEVVEGGATLKQLFDGPSAVNAIKIDGPWTEVVLQDQSTEPIRAPEETAEFANKFAQEIKRVSARPLLFETWALKGQMSSQPALKKAYLEAAASSSGMFVPAGEAFSICLSTHPEIELYGDDRHPNQAGTYLAACVFYRKIFGRTPVGLPSTLSAGGVSVASLDPKTAAVLQQVADKAAQAN
jgi:tetratricopeptide (TPR) repeat protein